MNQNNIDTCHYCGAECTVSGIGYLAIDYKQERDQLVEQVKDEQTRRISAEVALEMAVKERDQLKAQNQILKNGLRIISKDTGFAHRHLVQTAINTLTKANTINQ